MIERILILATCMICLSSTNLQSQSYYFTFDCEKPDTSHCYLCSLKSDDKSWGMVFFSIRNDSVTIKNHLGEEFLVGKLSNEFKYKYSEYHYLVVPDYTDSTIVSIDSFHQDLNAEYSDSVICNLDKLKREYSKKNESMSQEEIDQLFDYRFSSLFNTTPFILSSLKLGNSGIYVMDIARYESFGFGDLNGYSHIMLFYSKISGPLFGYFEKFGSAREHCELDIIFRLDSLPLHP